MSKGVKLKLFILLNILAFLFVFISVFYLVCCIEPYFTEQTVCTVVDVVWPSKSDYSHAIYKIEYIVGNIKYNSTISHINTSVFGLFKEGYKIGDVFPIWYNIENVKAIRGYKEIPHIVYYFILAIVEVVTLLKIYKLKQELNEFNKRR